MLLNFNLDRVKNKEVRHAVTYAVNSKSLIAGEGGAYGGDVAPNCSPRPCRATRRSTTRTAV